ncbi:MAG: hypothetical protein JW863_05765 [Chitinispirillaceae bacterium]|nr:hypothetical protein [Chitinispirillaceae bacterium]
MRITSHFCGVFLMMFGIPTLVSAAPVSNKPYAFRQPDGSLVSVIVSGDEFYQDVETPDGYSLIRDPTTGWICYSTLSNDGNEWISTGMVYDPDTAPGRMLLSRGIGKHLRLNKEAVAAIQDAKFRELNNMTMKEARQHFQNRVKTRLAKAAASAGSDTIPARTTPDTCVGLAILINFPDKTSDIPRDSIVNFFNMRGYSGYGNNGSLFDYYYDISDGKMVYTNIVTQFITADYNKSHYDAGTGFGGTYELLDEIGTKIQRLNIDLSPLTLSGSYIRATNVFYAGTPQAGWANGLWPNSGYRKVTLATGFSTNRYQLSDIGSSLAMGGSIHENGHMLCNWPDLYTYDDHDNGAGNYCIMSKVNDNNPLQPNGFFRVLQEWIPAINITSDGTGNLYSHTSNGPSIYLWSGATNGTSTNEAYYIEARRKEGRSKTLPDEGLLIWHVDKKGSNTESGTDYVMPEQADGLSDLERKRNSGGANDLFHAGYKTEFDDNTTPSAKWHNNTNSGIQIANISDVGEVMTFSLGMTVGTSPDSPQSDNRTCTPRVNGNCITYSIPQFVPSRMRVRIDLYDLNGTRITTFFNENQTAGRRYSVTLAGRNAISTGMYLFVMNAAGVTLPNKVFIK